MLNKEELINGALEYIRDVLNIKNIEHTKIIKDYYNQDWRRLRGYSGYPIKGDSDKNYIVIKSDNTHYSRDYFRLRHDFIKSVCAGLSKMFEIINRSQVYDNEKIEMIDLVKRLSIPVYIDGFCSHRIRPLTNTLNGTKVDYGRLIREVLRWSNLKIEGKQIHTGFIITDSLDLLDKSLNFQEKLTITFSEPQTIYDFSKIKSYLEIADGSNSFLVLEPKKDDIKCVGLIVSDTSIFPYPSFESTKGIIAPVFIIDKLGVKVGVGKQLILEFINGSPKVRNYGSLFNCLKTNLNERKENNRLRMNSNITESNAKNLVKLLIKISSYGKGSSVIFGFEKEKHKSTVENVKWITPIELPLRWGSTENDTKMHLLGNMSRTDGAVIVDRDYNIIGFGAVLKATNRPGNLPGGSRHKSMGSYTDNKKELLGIVISEDGPISIVVKNKLLFKL
ncbi:diadenylate cyclase [Evansella sp. AB-rgal1]|uniref:diadenylate cyclase n=1 Tax=Evansella sp. AB-rgal1 TaxID=3242696 RepID=UPI00359DEEA2